MMTEVEAEIAHKLVERNVQSNKLTEEGQLVLLYVVED